MTTPSAELPQMPPCGLLARQEPIRTRLFKPGPATAARFKPAPVLPVAAPA